MAKPIDPQVIERAEKALRRAGLAVAKTEANDKTRTVTFTTKVPG